MPGLLIGRDRELQFLESLLAGAAGGGASVLVRGAPGLGKTALAEAARDMAQQRGFTVLSCTGVRSETRLPFAGLHQLIRPILKHSEALSSGEWAALQVALGVTQGSFPEVARVGMAVLALLGLAAERSPVLLIADDTHWLDGRTCEVLAFVGRRLDCDAVVFLATCRDDDLDGNPLATAGLPELGLEPLRQDAATELLARHAADLDPTLRARILAEAAGNALALLELPAAARDLDLAAAAPDSMPITTRLQQAFAARLPQLPPTTRTILVVAALADQGGLTEILAAASLAAGSALSQADLEPATAAGLVRVAAGEVSFRHPLTRSAVRQAASVAERVAAHAALAEALRGEPARRAWHRAASTTGPDEDVALDLEGLATRAENAGATDVQAAALRRAAEVGKNQALRSERWLRAAEVSWEAGQYEQLAWLISEAESAGFDARQQARADYLREAVLGVGRLSGAKPIATFTAIADNMRLAGDYDRAAGALNMIAMRCYFSNPDASTRMLVVRAAEAMPSLDAMLVNVLALAAPVERGAAVIERLSAIRPGELRAADDHYLGTAATAVGAYDICGGFLQSAISRLRAEGRINHLAQALHTWAWAGVQFGDPAVFLPAAEEAHRLFSETGQTLWASCAQLVMAADAGRRGDAAASEALTAAAERTLLFAGLQPMLAMVHLVRGIAALGTGKHAEAYEILIRIFDAQDPVHHPHLRAWALADVVEAALYSGHRDDARKLCAELSVLAAATESPLLRVGLLISAPQLAADDAAGPLFETAMSSDLTAWPLHRARLQLAYGAWLRRRYRVAESREPLRAARDLLDALGAVPWAARARQELSATGERSLPRAIGAPDLLSPQELVIAQLAADGLSNREIGQQLYLSHRTVSSHLYRVFPKLGIASRVELPTALASRTSGPPG
ncbi:MAG TPA: AAA family ATPase [Streptosporangiaceae bacterium]|nr:AAA family ATPase [Streptosporangiaceae bacterium]